MPTNVYVSGKAWNEQNLYEDLVIESIKMYGQDVYFLPRSIVERDNILNEVKESKFDNAFMVEMYIENTEGFEGEGNLLSKFGLEIRDEATFIVAKRSWEKYVGQQGGDLERPFEGDLIYLPMSSSFFEISFVEHEQPFYQLQNLPVYKLQARLFEYSGEDFNTNVAEINSIQGVGITTTLYVNNISNSFVVGTRAIQEFDGFDLSGEIVRWDEPTGELILSDVRSDDGEYHMFTVDGMISNLEGAGTATIAVVQGDPQPDASNDVFEGLGDSIIDFSENNPFGEPGDL